MNGTTMPTEEVVPKLTQEEIDEMARHYSAVCNIALKLWWGWTPQPRQKKWSIVFENRTEKMTEEEVQWFRLNS